MERERGREEEEEEEEEEERRKGIDLRKREAYKERSIDSIHTALTSRTKASISQVYTEEQLSASTSDYNISSLR